MSDDIQVGDFVVVKRNIVGAQQPMKGGVSLPNERIVRVSKVTQGYIDYIYDNQSTQTVPKNHVEKIFVAAGTTLRIIESPTALVPSGSLVTIVDMTDAGHFPQRLLAEWNGGERFITNLEDFGPTDEQPAPTANACVCDITILIAKGCQCVDKSNENDEPNPLVVKRDGSWRHVQSEIDAVTKTSSEERRQALDKMLLDRYNAPTSQVRP